MWVGGCHAWSSEENGSPTREFTCVMSEYEVLDVLDDKG